VEVCDPDASIEEPSECSQFDVPSNVLLVINPTASAPPAPVIRPDYDSIASSRRSARSALTHTERSASDSERESKPGPETSVTSGYKLFSSQNLSHINLRNACVFDDGAWCLASYMSLNSFVKVLDLSHNLISDEGMQAIAIGLCNFVGLEVIKLSGNGFGFDGCRYLDKVLCVYFNS
jgi:hypothetical protein